MAEVKSDSEGRDHLFLRACRRESVERTPIWMMRQAGRYLPQYRATRARVSFLELCRTPELACEVTLQPIDEYGFDAAILFSDILVPFEGMGLEVEYNPAPVLAEPVVDEDGVDRVRVPDPADAVPYVIDAVRLIRKSLDGRVPLIGFAGAPFTLATYAIEGSGSKTYNRTKTMLFQQPAVAHALLDKLARAQALYLEAQVEAGAQAVQLFDSWAGILSPRDFREFALRYAIRVFEELRASRTFAACDSPPPIIYFVNGCAPYLDDLAACGADVLGVDWRVDLAEVRRRVGDHLALQGNMDPACLFLPPAGLRERVGEVLASAGGTPGHIFNLGHGVQPNTDPEQVRVMVQAVRELSAAEHAP